MRPAGLLHMSVRRTTRIALLCMAAITLSCSDGGPMSVSLRPRGDSVEVFRNRGQAYAAVFVPGDSVLSVAQSGYWAIHSLSGGSRKIGDLDAAGAVAFNAPTGTSLIATRAGRLFSLQHSTGTLTDLVHTSREFLSLLIDESAQLAYVGSDVSIEVYDIRAGQFIRSISTNQNQAIHLTLTPDRQKLYLSGNAALFELDLTTGAVRSLGVVADATAMTSDGKTLYAASGESVQTINPATGTVRTLLPLPCSAWGLALTRDERQLYVTCSEDGKLEIVDIGTAKVTRQHILLGLVRRVSFSADGRTAALGSESGVVIVR